MTRPYNAGLIINGTIRLALDGVPIEDLVVAVSSLDMYGGIYPRGRQELAPLCTDQIGENLVMSGEIKKSLYAYTLRRMNKELPPATLALSECRSLIEALKDPNQSGTP